MEKEVNERHQTRLHIIKSQREAKFSINYSNYILHLKLNVIHTTESMVKTLLHPKHCRCHCLDTKQIDVYKGSSEK